MGFLRQEYWSGLPFPSPGDHPDPGIKPRSPALLIISTLIDDHDAGTNRDNAWHVVKGHYPALLPFLLFLTAESFDLM